LQTMDSRTRGFPARLLVTVLVLTWGLAIGLSAAQSTTPSSQAGAVAGSSSAPPTANAPRAISTPPPQATGYVGAETCLTCHENADKGMAGTAHARAADPRSPAAAKACE